MPSFAEIWSALHEPLIWGMHAINLLVLLAVGVGWSATVWGITEGVKGRLRWQKPYTHRQHHALAWAPILVSGLLSIGAFPATLSGLSIELGPIWVRFVGDEIDASAIVSFGVGVVGGFGAKGAHDLLRKGWRLFWAWLNRRAGGND